MKFKVVKEYGTYYLAEHVDYGYKECFSKNDYKTKDGFIVRRPIRYSQNKPNEVYGIF